jgi:hypothetical protein
MKDDLHAVITMDMVCLLLLKTILMLQLKI